MYVELDPILPVLLGLMVLALWAATARMVGARAWWVLLVVLLVCFAADPDRARHVSAVRNRASADLGLHAARLGIPVSRSTGWAETTAEYQDFAVASVLTLHGKVLSVGLLGQVWVIDPSQPTRCTRSDSPRG